MAETYYSTSSYAYVLNNPVKLIDPNGMFAAPPSTHTDNEGNVIAVYDDGDNGVYRHNNIGAGVHPDGKQSQVDQARELSGTGGGAEKMGETEYWDEFRAHDGTTGAVQDEVTEGAKIYFGESWDATITDLNEKADKMGLVKAASKSTSGGDFDIKTKTEYAPSGAGTGKLLDGKYATARSAGNYLAGKNGATGRYHNAWVSKKTYMKLAGSVHVGKFSKKNAAGIVLFGNSYGPAPYYGEIEYAGRMIEKGWASSGRD